MQPLLPEVGLREGVVAGRVSNLCLSERKTALNKKVNPTHVSSRNLLFSKGDAEDVKISFFNFFL